MQQAQVDMSAQATGAVAVELAATVVGARVDAVERFPTCGPGPAVRKDVARARRPVTRRRREVFMARIDF